MRLSLRLEEISTNCSTVFVFETATHTHALRKEKQKQMITKIRGQKRETSTDKHRKKHKNTAKQLKRTTKHEQNKAAEKQKQKKEKTTRKIHTVHSRAEKKIDISLRFFCFSRNDRHNHYIRIPLLVSRLQWIQQKLRFLLAKTKRKKKIKNKKKNVLEKTKWKK